MNGGNCVTYLKITATQSLIIGPNKGECICKVPHSSISSKEIDVTKHA